MKLNIPKSLVLAALITFASFVNAQLLPPSAKVNSAPVTTSVGFNEGTDYRVLPSIQPTESKGKIEVVEFFWYACPHCYDLEPDLEAWIKRQKKDVVVKRVPIAFREDFLPHSQIYYALEALGKGDEFTPLVMKSIHVDHKQMLKDDEIYAWAQAQGIDRAAFDKAYKSFSVITKAKAANSMGMAYRVDGVPTIAVQGKYETSPSIAGTKARAIETLDFLVAKARAEKK